MVAYLEVIVEGWNTTGRFSMSTIEESSHLSALWVGHTFPFGSSRIG
jgi:hypothetical protein